MGSADLTPIVWVVAFLSWVSSAILVNIARNDTLPKSISIRERAWAAVAISLFVSIYAVVTTNADGGYLWWTNETGKIIIRLSVLLLGSISTVWLIQYALRRIRP